MTKFSNNGVTLSYEIHGEGMPILLLHGGCVDFNYNYLQTGWVDALTKQGYQVIGLDFRGHGKSDKSTDKAFYGINNLSHDAMNLIHHLNLKSVAVMGYSMGTIVALNLLYKHPEFFSKAILIATGETLIGQPPFGKIVRGLAKVFEFETFPDHLPKHVSAYWTFFKELGLDRASMEAFCLASYPDLTVEEVSSIVVPTLIISGEKDLVLGQGEEVAKKMVNGEYSEIENADHFNLAIDPKAHQEAINFLKRN
jgi:pimeloyl-ACP methyl ester carboxylesterase